MARYRWKRFWCPREGAYSLSDDGFLYDPEAEYARLANPSVRSFDAISDQPCLVLLGGPGSGKTFALTEERQARSEADVSVHWIDLREYGDEATLRALFAQAWFREWLAGSNRLEIFLDSFDECRTRIPTLIALLQGQLKIAATHSQRLRLRIACRTAEWPETLTATLTEIWGDAVRLYELVPLRKSDVIVAAATHGLDGSAFVQQIVERRVQPLAIRPVTLTLLLNIFRKDAELPGRLVDLYERGLRLLCEETQERSDAGLRPHVSAPQRLAIASRFAATVVLGNRFAIYGAPDRGEVPRDDVLLGDILGGVEYVDGNAVAVTDHAAREVLGTDLFSSGGAFRYCIAHQTYAEFLTARYLVGHSFSTKRIYSLLTVPDDPQLQIAPQLHETAAWLASLRADIFRDLLAHQPEILLRSDVLSNDSSCCAALIVGLLGRMRLHAIPDWLGLRPLLGRLNHPDLATQLAPVIRDKREPIESRWMAIAIAERCHRADLAEVLAGVALAEDEPLAIRKAAALAVAVIGEPGATSRLRPLALGQAGEDPDDELRGFGLRATWPAHLSAEELFASLSHPKDARFFGAYQGFLMRGRFLEHLDPPGLCIALDWLLDRDVGTDPQDPFQQVAHKLVCCAWAATAVVPVRQRLARVVARAVVKHYDVDVYCRVTAESFKALMARDPTRRRVLLASIVETWAHGPQLGGLLHEGLVSRSDFAWLVDMAQRAGLQDAKNWSELARLAFDYDEPTHAEIAYFARRACPPLDDALSQVFPESVDLDSPAAANMRAAYEQRAQLERQIRRFRPKALSPSPAERVRNALHRCLNVDPAWWPRLCQELTLDANSRRYSVEVNVTRTPGWKDATGEIRRKIVDAARRFVESYTATPSSWIGTNKVDMSDLAGMSALMLLASHDLPFIQSLPEDRWSGWGSVILGAPVLGGMDDEVVALLAEHAYRNSPERFVDVLLRLIELEADQHNAVFVLARVARCWRGLLVEAILDLLRRQALRPRAMGSVLSGAMQNGAAAAVHLAVELVPNPPPRNGDERERSIEAARCLLAHTPEDGSAIVWAALKTDAGWGRSVLERLCEGIEDAALLARLNDDRIGELLDWLYVNYPPASDPKPEVGATFMSGADLVRILRDRALEVLTSRGTQAAVKALERLRERHPELPWLWRAVRSAEDARRRNAWTPVAPRQLIELTRDADKRVVESGRQLLEVLIESLERLSAKLHGETPSVRFLWDTPPGFQRPKEENDLSDAIKIHLEEDLKSRGIVVNREVQIRRRSPNASEPGQVTDIRVDAASFPGAATDATTILTVIIEVKGCWHEKLKSALVTQLVDRYLHDNECQHGLYVVGWFMCDAWSDCDTRKGRSGFHSLSECTEWLGEQAAKVSQDRLAPTGEVRVCVLDCRLK